MRRTLLLSLLGLACAREPEVPIAAARAAGGSPLQGLVAIDDATWTGVVEERLDAGSYTYLAVRDQAALRWVAVMGEGEAPGSNVLVHALGVRTDFHSARLDRDFAELVFATVQPQPGSS
jgi:hypothetical protein